MRFTLCIILLFIVATNTNALTPGQRTLISKAKSNGLSLEILTVDINGKSRELVILGESHVKSKIKSVQELELIRGFDLIFQEGYAGNGGYPTFEERVTSIIPKLYPLLKLFSSGEESSISKSSMWGLKIAPSGKIIFKSCSIGYLNNEVYYDFESLKRLTKDLSQKDVNVFYHELGIMLAQLNNGRSEAVKESIREIGTEVYRDNKYNKCDEILDGVNELKKVIVQVETGYLGIWDERKVCMRILCPEGEISARDLRMANAVVAYLQKLKKNIPAILVVGDSHKPALLRLLKNWNRSKKEYLKY